MPAIIAAVGRLQPLLPGFRVGTKTAALITAQPWQGGRVARQPIYDRQSRQAGTTSVWRGFDPLPCRLVGRLIGFSFGADRLLRKQRPQCKAAPGSARIDLSPVRRLARSRTARLLALAQSCYLIGMFHLNFPQTFRARRFYPRKKRLTSGP